MKKNIQGLIKSIFLFVMLTGTLTSCKKMFDIAPEDALELDQAYQNVYDADAAVLGIYGKIMGIADRQMVLNELRADLEDVTSNADKYLKEINTHDVSADNPWSSPKPYYEIILNCNDALKNFDIMLRDKRFSQADYNIRYSEVGAIRSWLYLQLGIQYGSVPYITDALDNFQDIGDQSKYERIPLEQLLERLITFTESLPNKQPVPAGTSLLTTLDSYNTAKMFINKYLLLGDLYLWKNNYPKAAEYYHLMMKYNDVLYPTAAAAGENWFNTYTLGNNPTRIDNTNWGLIFNAAFGERYSNYEIIWNLPFDKRFAPKNPLMDLFYNQYLVKPSAKAINNWRAQTRTDNTPFDTWRGIDRSYETTAKGLTIKKPIYSFNKSTPFETTGKWILYRASMLHLRMAETANRDGRDKLAYALVNAGIRTTYTPKLRPIPANVTNIMQSFDSNPNYYFDGRNGETPRFRADYSVNQGVRGRVSLAVVPLDSARYFNMTDAPNENKPVIDRDGLTLAMEDMIIDEAALELAFEGNRWQDLLRIALRRKATDGNYLANKIAAKFEASGDVATAAAVRAKLAVEQNWYLPFKW